jgi:xylulose-5-phosphate/fructose-6-phosphate phosphoketolase
LPSAASDDKQLELLVKWLESYHPKELFNTEYSSSNTGAHNPGKTADGLINAKALRIIPTDTERRMGMLDVAYRAYKPLDLPDWEQFGKEVGEEVSAMKA